MRKFLYGVFGILYLSTALLTMVFLFVLLHAPAFERGKDYKFYFGANSSAQALSSDCPALDKLFLGNVKGESVRYEGDRYFLLKEKYRAEVQFIEEVCGITNYYMYSPCFRETVALSGHAVNLHIAVSGEETVIGTPLIFGGF